jgi:hypothetical protein
VSAVTAAVISPVVPPLLSVDSDRVAGAPGAVSVARRPLPLPLLIPRRTTALVYGLSALDDRGRLADRMIMQALGWSAGLGLDISETDGRLVIRPGGMGRFTSPAGAICGYPLPCGTDAVSNRATVCSWPPIPVNVDSLPT